MNLGFCAPTAMGSVSKNKLLVYPSILSAGETLHLKNNFQNVDYKIYNLTGSVVQEGKTSNSIPTKNDLAPATYFMQLKSKYEIYRTKIIIQ
jgi:hypothetical protein